MHTIDPTQQTKRHYHYYIYIIIIIITRRTTQMELTEHSPSRPSWEYVLLPDPKVVTRLGESRKFPFRWRRGYVVILSPLR